MDVHLGHSVREEKGEVPVYNIRDKEGWTPLFRTSSDEVIEHLLQFDDLQIFDKDGHLVDYLMDSLVSAIEIGDKEKVNNLISQHPKLIRYLIQLCILSNLINIKGVHALGQRSTLTAGPPCITRAMRTNWQWWNTW